MSTKYTGGFITKSPVAPTSSAASGIWTLDQQQQAQKAGTWPSPPIFIEDLFSTYLYTGNDSTQTITNGIDLSTKGGLVWMKSRTDVASHALYDTVRGATQELESQSTNGQTTRATGLTAFNSTGFNIGARATINSVSQNYVSWTFREQAKFFDVVTFTAPASGSLTVPHNLGSTPGCIIQKRTNGISDWIVYHTSTGAGKYFKLNASSAVATYAPIWANVTSTSFEVTVGSEVNANDQYVSYLFADNAGGFPASGGGSTNGISCGTFTTDGSGNATVTLGYEPQWLLIKSVGSSSWYMVDIMRGMATGGNDSRLQADQADAEYNLQNLVAATATGFNAEGGFFATSQAYIYIAIRRGPMKPPTVGTSVFNTQTATYSANQVVTTGFPVDMLMMKGRTISYGNLVEDRLRGLASTNTSPVNPQLLTTTPDGETAGDYTNTANNTGYQISAGFSGLSSVNWNFGRAPGFMDVVCYTGTGVQGRTVVHNLIVAPEFIIVKARDKVENFVGWSLYGPTSGSDVLSGNLNDTNLFSYTRIVGIPTTTTFAVSSNGETNAAGYNYVAYLFATLAGVSKVGSYTGTGAAQTINCGFTTGARFVLIKCTSSNATNWNVWDSARGIIPANDPYLSINLAAGEVTGTDYIDTTNVGFDITSTAPAEVNGNGSSFIFLAIA